MRLPPNYGDAILSLRPDARYVMHENDLENIEWVEVEGVPPTPAEIEAQLLLLQEEYEGRSYQRERASAYPSIGDQLDALFHAGAFPEDMAIQLQAVKDAYPKPETN